MGTSGDRENFSDGKSVVILQSLLCILREKGVLSRADIEELCDKLRTRAEDHAHDPLPCCSEAATAAASEIAVLNDFIGRRYGGKHSKHRTIAGYGVR